MSPHDPVPHRSRRERQPEQPERAFPHSWVRVLRSDDELHSAVETALAFERGVVERTTARVSHYEDLNRRGEIVPMRLDESRTGLPADVHPEAV